MRRLLPLLFLALPATAQEPATLEQHRGLQVITCQGQLESPPSQPLVARIRLGERTALQVPVAIDQLQVSVRIVTARRLLGGDYLVEVAAPGDGPALLEWPLKVEGSVDAGQLERNWLAGAAATVRSLASSLDRRARFHGALAREDAERAPLHVHRFVGFLQGEEVSAGWFDGLRTARMDLALFERRLLLPTAESTARAHEALERILDLLEDRAGRWQEVLERLETGPAEDLPDSPEFEEALGALFAALGRPAERAAFWSGGPQATPPPLAEPGAERYADPLGFSLQVPPGFSPVEEVTQRRRPDLRLDLRAAGGHHLVVEVRDYPDADGAEALREAVQLANWETWFSYKQLESAPLTEPTGLELRFSCNGTVIQAGEVEALVRQRALFDLTARRVVSAYLIQAPGSELPPGAEEAWRSLRLDDAQ